MNHEPEDSHKQWCQSICRQARSIMRFSDMAVSCLRFACHESVRGSDMHGWVMQSAVAQQVEALEQKKKLRRTLMRYGVSFTPVMNQGMLRKRFQRKAWLQRKKQARSQRWQSEYLDPER